jgi:hypothetical protein
MIIKDYKTQLCLFANYVYLHKGHYLYYTDVLLRPPTLHMYTYIFVMKISVLLLFTFTAFL